MLETAHPSVGVETCLNCGRILDGPFCAACGQAEHEGRHPTLAHFFHDLVHEFAHVDGTIFRTIKALLFQPGKLTEEYWAGHIVAWVRPIRLFLVIAAVHLLLSVGIGPLNLVPHITRDAKGKVSIVANSERLGRASNVPEEQQREFSEKLERVYHLIRYTPVLVFALGSWLLYRRRRPYFVSHLISGLHFYSFWYLLALLLSLPSRVVPSLDRLDYANVVSIVYLFLAHRRLFPEGRFLRTIKTIFLFVVLIVAEASLAMAALWWAMKHTKFT